MAVLARVTSLLRNLTRRSRIDRELDEELQTTVDLLTAEKGTLGFVGVLLAAIGVYGVTAYAVSRRRREIAIRTALGAQRTSVVMLVLRQGISLTAIGCAVGLALRAIAGQVLSALLIGVSPLDPVALTGAAGLCIAVAVVASWVPVHRAMRVAAGDALRSE